MRQKNSVLRPDFGYRNRIQVRIETRAPAGITTSSLSDKVSPSSCDCFSCGYDRPFIAISDDDAAPFPSRIDRNGSEPSVTRISVRIFPPLR